MRLVPFAAILFAVLAAPFSTTCGAEYDSTKAIIVLFDNGPMNHANGLGVTLSELAEDFELPFAADITSVTIGILDSGGNSFPDNWDGVIKWFIYSDDGGLPGTLLMSGLGLDSSYILESSPNTYEFYWLSFNLSRRVTLDVGVRYWFAVNLNSAFTTNSGISWAASTDLVYSPGAYNNPLGSGVYEPWILDFSYTLSSDTTVTYLFTDTFETGDLRFWTSVQP